MDDAEFREPRYRSDLNQGLGGSIELGDNYLFPVELPAEKVRNILEDQAREDAVRGSRFPFFSLELGQGQQYDLLYSGGKDEPVDAIGLYNSNQGKTVGFYEMEELVE